MKKALLVLALFPWSFVAFAAGGWAARHAQLWPTTELAVGRDYLPTCCPAFAGRAWVCSRAGSFESWRAP